MAFRIGELARRTRTNPPTIRYYEEIGLLPAPARRDGGQRSYGEEDERRLTFSGSAGNSAFRSSRSARWFRSRSATTAPAWRHAILQSTIWQPSGRGWPS